MRTIPELPSDISETMKQIGIRLTELRQELEPNYKKFADAHKINNMTLWRIQKGEDYKMSSLLQVLKAIDCSPEDFFKGIK